MLSSSECCDDRPNQTVAVAPEARFPVWNSVVLIARPQTQTNEFSGPVAIVQTKADSGLQAGVSSSLIAYARRFDAMVTERIESHQSLELILKGLERHQNIACALPHFKRSPHAF